MATLTPGQPLLRTHHSAQPTSAVKVFPARPSAAQTATVKPAVSAPLASPRPISGAGMAVNMHAATGGSVTTTAAPGVAQPSRSPMPGGRVVVQAQPKGVVATAPSAATSIAAVTAAQNKSMSPVPAQAPAPAATFTAAAGQTPTPSSPSPAKHVYSPQPQMHSISSPQPTSVHASPTKTTPAASTVPMQAATAKLAQSHPVAAPVVPQVALQPAASQAQASAAGSTLTRAPGASTLPMMSSTLSPGKPAGGQLIAESKSDGPSPRTAQPAVARPVSGGAPLGLSATVSPESGTSPTVTADETETAAASPDRETFVTKPSVGTWLQVPANLESKLAEAAHTPVNGTTVSETTAAAQTNGKAAVSDVKPLSTAKQENSCCFGMLKAFRKPRA